MRLSINWTMGFVGYVAFLVFVSPFLLTIAVIQLLMKAARLI